MIWPWTKRPADTLGSDLLIVVNRRLAAVLAVVAKDDPELLRAVGLEPMLGGGLRDLLIRCGPMGEEYVVHLPPASPGEKPSPADTAKETK